MAAMLSASFGQEKRHRAAVLGDLIRVLISKDGEEKLTKEEGQICMNMKSRVLRSSFLGATTATSLVYFVTRKLGTFSRVSLAGGAGILIGSWTFGESLSSCVDYVLDMDGSRMQQELKKILLQRYGDDPRIMQHFPKHFYREEVYNDLNAKYPRSIYRQRNTFMDDQRVADGNVYGVSDTDEQDPNHHQRNHDQNSVKLRGPSMEVKQVRLNPGISAYGYGDPLEVLFGYSLIDEEVQQPDESGDSAKGKGRAQKRARRKERMRRHRESSLGGAQLMSH